jgi:hypothetical protein
VIVNKIDDRLFDDAQACPSAPFPFVSRESRHPAGQ